VLARYEFTLLAARVRLARFSDDLRQVAEFVRGGRAILARARTRHEFRQRVAGEVTTGFFALAGIEAQLGSACGAQFTFWPPDGLELVGASVTNGRLPVLEPGSRPMVIVSFWSRVLDQWSQRPQPPAAQRQRHRSRPERCRAASRGVRQTRHLLRDRLADGARAMFRAGVARATRT
jgi:hypothetical protein